MKSILLLQGAFLLVLVHSPTPSHGNAEDIRKWLDDAGGVRIFERFSLPLAMKFKKIGDNLEEIANIKKIVAAKVKDENDLIVYWNDDPRNKVVDDAYKSNTNWLPYLPDKATFLQLNHGKGDFFTTAGIQGCDIWIADTEDEEQIVVHINTNKQKEDGAKNLKIKEDVAAEVLDYINKQSPMGVTFKYTMRVAYDYLKKFPDQKDTINAYWTTFKQNNADINPLKYYSNHIFYGSYYITEDDEGWKYHLKEAKNGGGLFGIKCSEKKDVAPSCVKDEE